MRMRKDACMRMRATGSATRSRCLEPGRRAAALAGPAGDGTRHAAATARISKSSLLPGPSALCIPTDSKHVQPTSSPGGSTSPGDVLTAFGL